DARPYAALPERERWVLHRTRALEGKVRHAYEECEFHLIYHALNNFCAVDLSSLYLDVRKDRLYCERPGGRERRATQTVLHAIVDRLVRAIDHVLSFIPDDARGWRPEVGA